MIHPRILRTLELEEPLGLGGPRHLAAGSGLVVIGDYFYVVADDALQLACFRRSSAAKGSLVRMFPGELPSDHDARKAVKPDLEALLHLQAFSSYAHGALLAVPSGSTARRCKGALLRLDANGAVIGDPEAIDFSGLYAGLAAQVQALNIEGAVVVDDTLVLLHRGSQAHPLSAMIELPLPDIHVGLATHGVIQALQPSCLRWVDLGAIDGVPLSITDAAILPDGRLIVAAVAENAADSYADGPCLGAAIGVLDRDGQVNQLQYLQPQYKIEGVQAWTEHGRTRVWLVTDADDETIPSVLLELELELPAAVKVNVN